MLTIHQKQIIADLPKTEYGQALSAWLQEEIALLENREEHGSKICDDPLSEDFRVELGKKLAFKSVLNKPSQCFDELQNTTEVER